ncbi:MAG TPA: DJ-1/PfpI family protein, partial [bacterium]|nr:DJ-1/PfpI family protein [bacterium]
MSATIVRVVLMVLAFINFRDEEYRLPREMLEKAGYRVVVASTRTGLATGMLGLKVPVEKLLEEVSAADFAGLILVGGSGTPVLYEHRKLQELVREFVSRKKPVGAVCLAPVILVRAGVLKSRKATVYAGAAGELKKAGVSYCPEPVVVDGLIVTAD